MQTYAQWRESQIAERMATYECDREAATFFVSPADWWQRHIRPALDAGDSMPLPVCRAVADNGGGYSLSQIQKFYPDAIPPAVDLRTGRIIKYAW